MNIKIQTYIQYIYFVYHLFGTSFFFYYYYFYNDNRRERTCRDRYNIRCKNSFAILDQCGCNKIQKQISQRILFSNKNNFIRFAQVDDMLLMRLLVGKSRLIFKEPRLHLDTPESYETADGPAKNVAGTLIRVSFFQRKKQSLSIFVYIIFIPFFSFFFNF